MDNIDILQKRIDNLQYEIDNLKNLFYKDNFSNLYIERKDYQHSGKRLSFYGLTPIIQPQSTGETTGASDVTLNNATTFTGNNGSTAYTVLDLVKHFKNLGIIKK
jgi:hypothetical protein